MGQAYFRLGTVLLKNSDVARSGFADSGNLGPVSTLEIRQPPVSRFIDGCALKDLSERKAEWELDVEPPAVRENSRSDLISPKGKVAGLGYAGVAAAPMVLANQPREP
jgi:hypothetical protein